MESFFACLVILKISFCSGQFAGSICVDDVEIAFSAFFANFTKARESCQIFGGDLVKIGSSEILIAIQRAVGGGLEPEYYIGAYDDEGDNTFLWVADNTTVPLRSGYQYWRYNQPNSVSEKCVAIGVHRTLEWDDVVCHDIRRYICQREIHTILNVIKKEDKVICVSNANDITVRWKRNSVVAKSSDTTGAHQTIGPNNATLYLENANITEGGNYICSTSSFCSAQKIVTGSYIEASITIFSEASRKISSKSFVTMPMLVSVFVDGTPTIRKIENFKCNTNLRVTWKLKKAAVGFKHRISASNATHGDVVMFVTPTNHSVLSTEISKLAPAARYNVKVSACLEPEVCDVGFDAVSAQDTDGVEECKIAEHVCKFAALQIQWVMSRHFLGMSYKLIVLDTSFNMTQKTNVQFLLSEVPVINITESESRPGFCKAKSGLKNSVGWETFVDLTVGHTRAGKLATVAVVQHLQPAPGYKLTIFNME